MKNTMKKVAGFLKSEKGQGMVEYGLIIALVSIVVIGAIVILGDNLISIFDETASTLSGAVG